MRFSLWMVLLISVFLLTISFLACGDDDDDSSDDDDSGGTEDDDDAVDDDDAADDDDSSDDDDAADDDDTSDDDSIDDDDSGDDDIDFEDRWGKVVLSEGYASSNLAPLAYYHSVSANFSDPDDGPTWYDEPEESSGGCDRYAYDTSDPVTYNFLDGGTVTVTGASVSPITLTAAPSRFGYTYTANYDPLGVTNFFDQGDTIAASSVGNGSLPAFSAQATAPDGMQIAQPADFDSLTTLQATDWTFKWNAKNAPWFNLNITTGIGTDARVIICQAVDADGQLTVPGELLEDIHANPDFWSVTLSRTELTRDTVDGKDFDLMVMTGRSRTYIDN